MIRLRYPFFNVLEINLLNDSFHLTLIICYGFNLRGFFDKFDDNGFFLNFYSVLGEKRQKRITRRSLGESNN